MSEGTAREIDLEALAAELKAAGWSVYKTSSYPEVMLRFDDPKRGLAFWHQIHAGKDICYIDLYLDSELMGAPVVQGGVDITSEPWVTALPIINRHYGIHRAGALAPAGLTSDTFTERDLDTIGLAVWGTSTAMTERRFVGLDLIEKLHACGFDIVRVAPAADAAPGAPS